MYPNIEHFSDISPIILAAQLNQFEILQMLLRKDARIERPHRLEPNRKHLPQPVATLTASRYSCICETCDRERLNDSLQYSLKRINTYRALASPAWMSLTSPDPILSAFKLSWELQQLAVVEHEFKETYLQLAEQCKQFACDLISQCRSSEEVIAVLNKDCNAHDENVDVWASKLSLSRLKLAIKYEQKAFVSHPHCQQLLTSIWYEGFPGRQQRGSAWNIIVCIVLIILWPVLAVCYILMPKSRIGRIVRSPFMKFLYYSISFGCFLLLLTLATFESYRSEKGERKYAYYIQGGGTTRASDRGPPPTFIESLVVAWVLGMLWSEIKQLWEEGFTKYVHQWWNWLDFIMICLYLCTISV
ncbi:transient receptor ion channel II, partial [Ancylostoma duodenale]